MLKLCTCLLADFVAIAQGFYHLKMPECYVIITTRNLLWMVLSVAATLAVITGVMTPKWLIGKPQTFNQNGTNLTPESIYRPTLGIYNRCLKITRVVGGRPEHNCGTYAKGFMEIPSDAWKACVVFLCIGTFLLAVVVFMSLVGFCIQSVGKKSIFSLGGVIQALAGMLYYVCSEPFVLM